MSGDATCAEVRDLLTRNPDSPGVTVTEGGRPLGIVARSTFAVPFIEASLGNGLGDAPALRLMNDPLVTIEAETPLPEALLRLGQAELFVVVRDEQYLGIASTLDLRCALKRICRVDFSRSPDCSERLRDIAETAPLWIWERNEHGRYTYVSPRFEALTGIPAEKLVGLTPVEAESLGIKVGGLDRLLELMAARQPYKDLPLQLTLPDGRILHWRATAKTCYHPDGSFAGYRGTSTDVTEMMRRELEIARRTEGLRRFATHVPGVVFRMRIDARGEYSFPYISEQVKDIYGVTPEEVYADPRARFQHVHPDDMDRLRAATAESRERLTPWACPYRICRNGRTIWMQGNAIPERQPDGSTIWDGVSIDITPLKEQEAHLRDALAAAEAANAAKRDFLATVTHELRTPLNAIIGFAEVLKSEVFGPIGDSGYLEYAGEIGASGRHLLSLINDILDYARLEASRNMLAEENTALGHILDEALRRAAPRAQERGVSLSLAPWSEPIVAKVDHARLLQVVDCLVSNAVKFTPPGGSVVVGASMDATGSAELRVSDTGPGIPESDLPHVFEPFWQAGGSRDRVRQEGAGLGLALAKRLVEFHGGEIALESRAGHGMTARVMIPPGRVTAGAPEAHSGADMVAGAGPLRA